MNCPFKLPPKIAALPKVARSHRFAARDTVVVELAVFHGFGATQIPLLDCGHIDATAMTLQRPNGDSLEEVRTGFPDCWLELTLNQSPASPLIRTKSGARMSRVDVWRVLRRVGMEAGLETPVNTRQARQWLGETLVRQSGVSALKVASELGVTDLRAVSRFFLAAI